MNKLRHSMESINAAAIDTNVESGAHIRKLAVAMENHLREVGDLTESYSLLNGVVLSVESIETPTNVHFQNAHQMVATIVDRHSLSMESLGLDGLGLEQEKSGAWAKFVAFIKNLLKIIGEMLKKAKDFLAKFFTALSLEEKIAIAKLGEATKKLKTVRHGMSMEAHVEGRPGHHFAVPFDASASTGSAFKGLGVSGGGTPTISFADLLSHLKTFDSKMEGLHNDIGANAQQLISELREMIDRLCAEGVDPAKAATAVSEVQSQLENFYETFRDGVLTSQFESLVKEDGTLPLAFDRSLLVTPKHKRSADDGAFTPNVALSSYRVIQIPREKLGFPASFRWEAFNPAEVDQLIALTKTMLDDALSSNVKTQWKKNIDGLAVLMSQTNASYVRMLDQESIPAEVRSLAGRLLNCAKDLHRLAVMPHSDLVSVNMRVVNSLIELINDSLSNLEMSDGAEKRARDREALQRAREQEANFGKPRKRG